MSVDQMQGTAEGDGLAAALVKIADRLPNVADCEPLEVELRKLARGLRDKPQPKHTAEPVATVAGGDGIPSCIIDQALQPGTKLYGAAQAPAPAHDHTAVMRQALDAMQSDLSTYNIPPTAKMLEAIAALRTALSNSPAPAVKAEVPDGMVMVSVERLRKIFTLAKMAGDNIVAHSKAGKGMTGWLDDACTYADSAGVEIAAICSTAAKPAVQVSGS